MKLGEQGFHFKLKIECSITVYGIKWRTTVISAIIIALIIFIVHHKCFNSKETEITYTIDINFNAFFLQKLIPLCQLFEEFFHLRFEIRDIYFFNFVEHQSFIFKATYAVMCFVSRLFMTKTASKSESCRNEIFSGSRPTFLEYAHCQLNPIF